MRNILQRGLLVIIIFFGQGTSGSCATTQACDKQPRILRVLVENVFGGVEEQTMTACKALHDRGYFITLLVARGMAFDNALTADGIPHHLSDAFKYTRNSKAFKDQLSKEIEDICKKDHIDIIHCHKDHDYAIVKKIGKKLHIGIVAHYHSHVLPRQDVFNGFDAFVASSPEVVSFLQRTNAKKSLGIKHIEFIPPPHDEKKFLEFDSSCLGSREDFFKKSFNIDLESGIPVIGNIANLFAYKNHELLINAMHALIYKKGVPCQLVVAGEGCLRKKLEKQIYLLHLEDYVHLIGFTRSIPELLFFSDVFVLPSKQEAFGIVLMEAALMKKPIILSQSAALARILIQDGKTGLLCSPSNPADLANKLELLIKNNKLKEKLGSSVFDLVINDFSTKASIDRFESIYLSIFKNR